MNHYFYDTIYQLRSKEELILYTKLIDFEREDEMLVVDFLKIEYDTEVLNYPFAAPPFNAEAALWAAKTVYTSCQILLYRKHQEPELPTLLPSFAYPITAAEILSADLCLRFLPRILEEARLIDIEDALIPILEGIVKQWHYSGIGHLFDAETIHFEPILMNPCLTQLYIDRVIEKKDLTRALLPPLKEKINATLGNHTNYYWKTLTSAQ